MRVLGIDLAASPKNTAACLLDGLAATLHDGCDDDALVALAKQCDKVAIDAPFGWPDPFVTAVVAHRDGRVWPTPPDTPTEDHRAALSYRLTDRIVMATRRPLSVSSDRIGVTAMRCAHLLQLFAEGEPVDRTGKGRFVEVYPAAALARWGLDPAGYKGRDSSPVDTLLTQLREHLTSTAVPTEGVTSHHALDALVSALVGRAAVLGLTTGPSAAERDTAAREGWIHAPLRGTLRLLERDRVDLGLSPKPTLAGRLAAAGTPVDRDGYVDTLDDAFLPSIHPTAREAVERDLQGKGGSELAERGDRRPKFLAAHSSASLVANTFAPFIGREADIALPVDSGYAHGKVALEGRLGTGLQGGAATVDCLIRGERSAVAIEVKLAETFEFHVASFSRQYDGALERLHRTWRNEHARLLKDPRHYRFLDAAQLVKHYVGLRTTFPRDKTTLAYLYWTPQNLTDVPAAVVHAAEVAAFACAVNDPRVSFVPIAYRDLVELWSSAAQEPWLRDHATALAERYVAVV